MGILDFGFWILDFGFWILDFGLRIADCGHYRQRLRNAKGKVLASTVQVSDFGFVSIPNPQSYPFL
jgi:hypothetical protein